MFWMQKHPHDNDYEHSLAVPQRHSGKNVKVSEEESSFIRSTARKRVF